MNQHHRYVPVPQVLFVFKTPVQREKHLKASPLREQQQFSVLLPRKTRLGHGLTLDAEQMISKFSGNTFIQ
jgi:hypothetical protein